MLRKVLFQSMFVLALCVFAGALMVIGSMTAGAQPAGSSRNANPPPSPGEGSRGPVLESILGLNDKQAVALLNALESERAAMHALEESLRPKRDAIRAATRSKLEATLSAAQLERYDEWREAHRPPLRRPIN